MQTPAGKNRMDKRPGVIRPLFNRMAATYDRGNRTLSLLIDQVWRRRTVSALSIRDGQYVLDIATGTADMALTRRAPLPAGASSCRATARGRPSGTKAFTTP